MFLRHPPGAFGPAGDHLNYLFYETDPGVAMPTLVDLSRERDTTASLPEWAWWHFTIDDVTAGKGDFMMSITDATDPDLSRERSGQLGAGELQLPVGAVDSAISTMGLLTTEAVVRLGGFASMLALLVLWEALAPRRTLRVGRRRWSANLTLTLLNFVRGTWRRCRSLKGVDFCARKA